ncbi:MAG: DUF971 domain-containing protein [Anaerolineales bacterium]|nr:DUF971 domain-containing protein [Anaerolineales bacterium]
MDNLKPKHIKASKSDRSLTIEWNDGHKSIYPLDLLRAACPCAECRETHGVSSPVEFEDSLELAMHSSDPTTLTGIEKMGNYAIQLNWQDGHRYGIYTWDYLLSLCPCEKHAGSEKEDS